ncbi:hypothetical protein O181_028940 [Austropuccinia psidii MF-1]|uniref:Uncharacterized protein n=1 Tax=Austropuccinia psidii MF-1 TaxID=1389203 RepID=A0A9Q3CTN1_9BASI|nr:hypothetical protein [Austropuccinia psidii MF-1]
MSEDFHRETAMEGAASSRRGECRSRLGEEAAEGEESEDTEVEAAWDGAPEASEAFNLAHFNKPLVSQVELNSLNMMEKITQLMGHLNQAVSPRDNSTAREFKTASIKSTYSFDDTQAHELRGLIQSCQLIFHNYPEHFFSDRKKVF